MAIKQGTVLNLSVGSDVRVDFARFSGQITVTDNSGADYQCRDTINIATSGEALQNAVRSYLQGARYVMADEALAMRTMLERMIQACTESVRYLEEKHPDVMASTEN